MVPAQVMQPGERQIGWWRPERSHMRSLDGTCRVKLGSVRRLAVAILLARNSAMRLPRSLSMACGFVRGDASSQTQSVQIVFTIFADPPVFGSRDHNGGNRLQALHHLLRLFEASQMGKA